MVLVYGHGKVERFLSAVRLSIVNEKGQVLTEIGVFRAGVLSIDCVKVGKKVRCGETPQQSLSRLLQEDIPSIANTVRILQTEIETKAVQSKTWKLPTTVTCTTFTAVLNEPLESQVPCLDLGH